ncbi:MAG: hypothetical protein HKN47_23360 [Pirellulaceae bacterium]|nr:hypothetical protein [Pirellulaceae bacterium]
MARSENHFIGCSQVPEQRKLDREAFLELLADQFPEVVATIDEISTGLLHLEVAAFRRCVENAADSSRLWDVQRYLKFVDDIVPRADDELGNAIGVSFIEDFALECNDARRNAIRERAPKRIREMIVVVNSQWR